MNSWKNYWIHSVATTGHLLAYCGSMAAIKLQLSSLWTEVSAFRQIVFKHVFKQKVCNFFSRSSIWSVHGGHNQAILFSAIRRYSFISTNFCSLSFDLGGENSIRSAGRE